ncbi:hypothetical protein [uncultured Flavobacterium sp.]|uniref:hypothetical protein n=1 Tax=uncultured Flavobacterium sp. TaxID=165435 RepID=UPI002600F4BA|nr:hypothetical protein [uncultured Flavobacterium sp.]
MKTSEKLSFPVLKNEYVENILRQLLHQYAVCQVFYTAQDLGLSYLVVHLEQHQDAALLQSRPWVRKARARCQIAVSFVSSTQLEHRYSLGHPFAACYYTAASLIYQDSGYAGTAHTDRDWKRHKKKFRAFSERFYNGHDLQQSQARQLISEEGGNSVFASYARLLDYELQHLEELYCGRADALSSLDERITKLTDYVPAIQKFFVRGKGDRYYLTELFVKVQNTNAGGESFYHTELHEALAIAERNLFDLICGRYSEMKRLLKKRVGERGTVSLSQNTVTISLPDEAMELILRLNKVEQIYLYHQAVYGAKTISYLLLVAQGISNEQLGRLGQSLKSRMGEVHEFVVISHDRCWIQSNLYAHQQFFATIMQNQFLVYALHAYHPELHWEAPHEPYHADLYFYYRPAKDSASQFMAIPGNATENYQGLDAVFAQFFLSFCRTFIFVKTYYVPNYLSSEALWQLCLYGDGGLRKYQYLIDNFWTDFFCYVDGNSVVRPKLSILDKGKAGQMRVLVGILMGELHEEVVEGGLLGE